MDQGSFVSAEARLTNHAQGFRSGGGGFRAHHFLGTPGEVGHNITRLAAAQLTPFLPNLCIVSFLRAGLVTRMLI